MSSPVTQAKSAVSSMELGEGVGFVGVEAGGDDEEVGFEGLQRGDGVGLPGGAKSLAAVAGGEREVEDVVGHARFVGGAGAGVAGGLVAGDVEEIGVGLENMLGAVAVVDVEIDDRDACEAPALAGVPRGNGRRAEETEAHGLTGLGVVAGGTGGAEGGIGAAFHHGIDAAMAAPAAWRAAVMLPGPAWVSASSEPSSARFSSRSRAST